MVNGDSMEVRDIEFSELSKVLSLYDEFDRPPVPWPSQEQQQNIYRALIDSGGHILVAVFDNTIVGTCTLNLCQNFSWSGRPYAIIENVIVTQTFRSKGVGKALLSYAIKLAENKNCYKVALMTSSKEISILKFYEAAGFSGDKQGFQKRFNS